MSQPHELSRKLPLGVAVIGSVLTAQTVRHAVASLTRPAGLPASLKVEAIARLHALGPNFSAPATAGAKDAAALDHILASAVSAGTRPALLFAAAVVGMGALLSLLIPRIGPQATADQPVAVQEANAFAFEPVDVEPSVVIGD
jgi:hypothetical protein